MPRIIKRYITRSFFYQFIPLWVVLSISYLLLESGDLLAAFTSLDNPMFFLMIFLAFGFNTTLPASFIVSMVMVLSKHKKDGEIDIIRTSGYDVRKLFLTIFKIALAVVLVQMILIHFLMPQVQVFRKQLKWRSSLYSLMVTPHPGPVDVPVGNLSISYKRFTGGKFEALIFKKFSEDGHVLEEYQAKEAEMFVKDGSMHLKLIDAVIIIRGKNEIETRNEVLSLSIEKFFEDKSFAKPKYLSSPRLLFYEEGPLRELLMRFITNITIVFIAIVAFAVGVTANLTSTIAGVAVSIPLLLIYYLLHISLNIVYEKSSMNAVMQCTAVYFVLYMILSITAVKQVPK